MNKKQSNVDKDVLKAIVRDSLTKGEAIKALTGEGKGTLKIGITSKPVHKWFLNEEPISEKEFNRLSAQRMLDKHGKCKINVIVNGKPFVDADKDMKE